MAVLSVVAGLCLGLGWAPSADAAQPGPAFTAKERALILSHGPWPPAPAPDLSNAFESRADAIAFGRSLMKDRRLSASGGVACTDCHMPRRAFQDGRPVPVPRPGSGPGGHRNTPGLHDVAQWRWFGWGGAHDSLWSASLAALLNRSEMGHTVAGLAAVVRGGAGWASGYRRVFGPPGTDDERIAVNVAKALAAWQATLVSPRTPFDDFRDALARGDTVAAARYPQAAQRGLRLFIGEGRCAVCHSGPGFSNREFADIGIPFFVPGGVDAGRHEGLSALRASPFNRLGRHSDAGADADARAGITRHVAQEHRHFGEFRVPSLRGLVQTAPYMHDGSLSSLRAVVQHYAALDENRLHADGESILRPLQLDASQAADLETFLRSLSPAP